MSKIKVENIKVGSVLYSDYTKSKYVVTHLPKPFKEEDCFALVRMDGRGYCYLRKTLNELQKEIYWSGEDYYLIKDDKLVMVEGC